MPMHPKMESTGRLVTFSKSSKGDLIGKIEIPLSVGIVGGVSRVHPAAKMGLEILGAKSAGESCMCYSIRRTCSKFCSNQGTICRRNSKGAYEITRKEYCGRGWGHWSFS